LLSIHFFLNFGTRPGHFFGGLGLLVGAVGTLILAYLAVIKWMGEDIGTRPLMFVGFFCIVSGLQFITTGVLSEMLMRTYFDGGQSLAYHTRDLTTLDDNAGWHATP
jgi:hypothetical protein